MTKPELIEKYESEILTLLRDHDVNEIGEILHVMDRTKAEEKKLFLYHLNNLI